MTQKKVLLFIIDALASRVVFPALSEGKLPHLQALIDAGEVNQESTAIFPSITPAALSTLITGVYPDKHGVPGVYWYNPETHTTEYFGGDIKVVLKEGPHHFYERFLIRLSNELINHKTLFESVEHFGKTAACLNFFVYKGLVKHEINMPLLLGLIPGIPFSDIVEGPSVFYLGDFVRNGQITEQDDINGSGGMFNRYGFNDDNTFDILDELAKTGTLPDFTVAYCPDNDWDSHEDGPREAVSTLEHFDKRLGEFITLMGGLENMLDYFSVIVTGDHAQTDMTHDEERRGINLSQLLQEFSIVEPGKTWENNEQLMVCPNLRAAQIYFNTPKRAFVDRVIADALAEDRIDQVILRQDLINDDGNGYMVFTADRGTLHFWQSGENVPTGDAQGKDRYGFTWHWSGDLATLSGILHEDGTLHFPEYPNAFERIATALDFQRSGNIWLTACPGHDIIMPGFDIHEGGSHGTLHAQDSLSPLIMAGAPDGVHLPNYPRSIDVPILCQQILGMPLLRPLDTSVFQN